MDYCVRKEEGLTNGWCAGLQFKQSRSYSWPWYNVSVLFSGKLLYSQNPSQNSSHVHVSIKWVVTITPRWTKISFRGVGGGVEIPLGTSCK